MSSDSRDLRVLSERIEQMWEEECARIARELHDELGQLLIGIKLDFVVMARCLCDLKTPGDVVDRLQSVIGQVDIGIVMVWCISSDLWLAVLDHHDLGGVIEHEGCRVVAWLGLCIRVSSYLIQVVAPELAMAAFRIFQEALINVVRHVGATRIRVRIIAWERCLRLYLRDNGMGILEERMTIGLGLLGMRERVERFGGELRIRSHRGCGTLVAGALPLGEP